MLELDTLLARGGSRRWSWGAKSGVESRGEAPAGGAAAFFF